MSSMLEQAIVDAAALREAALKNAEQSIIEKYAPQIKEAVDSLLDKDVLEEQEVAASAPEVSSIEAPFAATPSTDPNQEVTFTMTDEDKVYEFDLSALKKDAVEEPAEGAPETTEDLMGDLGLTTPEEGGEELGGEEALLEEIANILTEFSDEEIQENEEVIEEELIVDMSGQDKGGWIETSEETLQYREEMELAKKEATEEKEKNEKLKKENKELSKSLKNITTKNEELIQIVNKLDSSLKETLLSNAKLLYSNQTLSDASLNERQKSKIVEAIAKAKTPEEAKNLQEALKTTVGTTKDDGPKSLRESVNRKSNLSGIMPRRNKPEQQFTFAEQMKKLAGIK